MTKCPIYHLALTTLPTINNIILPQVEHEILPILELAEISKIFGICALIASSSKQNLAK